MKTQTSSRGLNPEAPEFFPARNPLISAPSHHPFYSFLHYQTLYSWPYFPYHHTAAVSGPYPSSKPLTVAQEMVPSRRRSKDKPCLRSGGHGKEGFVRAKLSGNGTVYRKKVKARDGKSKGEKRPLIPLRDDGKETTVMIKNIPNRYTREMLKDFLDQHCMDMNRKYGVADDEPSFSAFDFLYLPIDFTTKSNKGYAFVNFTNPRAARRFLDACHDELWNCFQSTKIREIYCAKLQGMEELVGHFERMGFPCEEFQPVRFYPARDGSKQRVEEALVGRLIHSP
ncbi:Xylulose kinase-1 isoform 1 [Hibiscus syriacus]|uniref:Xylulose kinase-1 isoform 1 n=1 Tax=Hibiscus syriacus TaxID=106335 RepID=A0A6A2WPL7_HIBSY|nr:protein terminal ear1-like [Hibiscus syriacus]KAE8662573.1 Xylulose kinase-1 isoform 1 [Hibiscus syriacus]